MLYLVGFGLYDEKDISLRGYEILQKSDMVFVDRYTHIIDKDALERLSTNLGKEIIFLDRTTLENEVKVLENAQNKDVALLVGGDPLVATTHISLLQSCKQQEIPYKVIHGSSIISAAIGESGLQTYKFGKSVTLTFWYDNYRPTTPYKVIKENIKRGLHTLVFIDLQDQKAMDFPTIKQIFKDMEKEENGNLLEDFNVLILSKIGYPDQKITFGNLLDIKNPGSPPFIMIVPGPLHFIEEEWLDTFKEE